MFRIIRIISGISVTTLAYLGVKKDFKVDGKLTSTGNIVILAAIVLVLTSIILEILEYFRHRRDTKEMNDKFENLKFQLSKPVLPFDFRSVIKYTTSDDVIKGVFGAQICSFQKIIDLFKDKGKFIHPGLANFPWDEDHQTNEYILCLTEKEKLKDLIENNNRILKQPFSGTIEIYKKNKYDLRGAKMKIKLDILTHDKTDFTDTVPYLTFLQFKCGERPFNLIQFDTNFLPKPKIKKNSVLKPNNDETTNEFWADHLTLYYELLLPDENFENYIEQYN